MPIMTFARAFALSLLAVATLAFVWLVTPFWGAILWAVIAAVLFDPLNAYLLRTMPRRRNLAALFSLLAIIALVVVPAVLIGGALVGEAKALYARMQSGDVDFDRLFAGLQGQLPDWARDWLGDVGLSDMNGLRAKLSQGLATGFQAVATRVLSVGQGTLGFFLEWSVMLYLTFFLLRDGREIARRIERALPIEGPQRAILVAKFLAVIRATIKGSLIVAVLQGTTGSLTFWILGIPGALFWGVAMGFFSLFPAIGTGLIWVPMSLYLFATGAVWQATSLFACGFFIISSVDNVVRPFLVGHDARMPDYIVLLATLGGFEFMGFNGFVAGPIIAALFLAAWEAFAPSTGAVQPKS